MQKRVVLVTGAARGLGAAIAARFHAAGYAVAIGDIAFDAAQALARDLSADGSSAFALNLDVTAKTAFETARDAILKRWGRVDALVNNAGASKVIPVMEITAEQFDQVINVNLRSISRAVSDSIRLRSSRCFWPATCRCAASFNARCTRSSICCELYGFSTKSIAPFCNARTDIGISPCPLTKRIGKVAPRWFNSACAMRSRVCKARSSI
ncbi:4-formylbenzenesulfonate dehydrogenase TsaC1/TsaC2 [Paraburkholderia ultramafica]|uniref:4-formylbenzenesulfonate dehydrogenase TsaC1/TsaC2 n=1 Tax=Paraburkholderia ultramafica TaxID=1544867 RepID=A0A6S7B7M4_9BURK|nr:4-formylbenzenesulfonate dehydrogenase TsaC1/TsaC2 [Paraburkholderia ultramafica]